MSVIVAIIFIIIGFAIKNGKMYNLIAGYNTMSKEKQAEYNIEKIAILFKNVMFVMATIILSGYLVSKWLSKPLIEFYTILTVVITGVIYLVMVSNSKNFHKKD